MLEEDMKQNKVEWIIIIIINPIAARVVEAPQMISQPVNGGGEN